MARYDVFKLSEAVLAGQRERVQRMLDLQAEGPKTRCWCTTPSPRTSARSSAPRTPWPAAGLPMVLREQRVQGVRERLFERVLPRRLTDLVLANLLHGAHQVDGIVKGLQAPGWPRDPWQALHRLALGLTAACAGTAAARR